jgi:hypothetical protein
MNGTQIRNLLGIVACVAIYTGTTSAGKRLMTASDERRAWVDAMNTDANLDPVTETGIAYFTSMPANTQMDGVLEPPDNTKCDAWLDFVAQDQKFLQDLGAMGFESVGCVRYENGKSVWTARKLSPKPAPAKKQPATPDPQGARRLA